MDLAGQKGYKINEDKSDCSMSNILYCFDFELCDVLPIYFKIILIKGTIGGI